MITLEQYFNNKRDQATDEQVANATRLLPFVNAIMVAYFHATGATVLNNPTTGNQISGNRNGDGGFRLGDSKTGVATSSHKEGRGIDLYDPIGTLDQWLNDTLLAQYHLYREDPGFTVHWCHLTDRAPDSGRRTFKP